MNYNDIDAINWSRLKSMRISALQFKHDLERPREETGYLRVGLAAHCLLLEPEEYEKNFALFTGKVRRGKAWEEFKAEHPNRTIVIQSEFDQALGVVAAVQDSELARGYMGGVPEKPIVWTDGITGVKCKGRPDLVNGTLVELKSTSQIEPRQFAALAHRLGYMGQLAFYYDGLMTNGADVKGDPIMIVVESSKPHDLIVYRVTSGDLEHGRAEYRACLERYVECKEKNMWPGIAKNEEMIFTLPEYAYSDSDILPAGDTPLEYS